MRSLVLAAVGSLVMTGSAASEPSAVTPGPPPPTAAAPPAPGVPPANTVEGVTVEGVTPDKKDPVTCKMEAPIGSRLGVRVCVRKSEAERQKRESQEALQLLQTRSHGPRKSREAQ